MATRMFALIEGEKRTAEKRDADALRFLTDKLLSANVKAHFLNIQNETYVIWRNTTIKITPTTETSDISVVRQREVIRRVDAVTRLLNKVRKTVDGEDLSASSEARKAVSDFLQELRALGFSWSDQDDDSKTNERYTRYVAWVKDAQGGEPAGDKRARVTDYQEPASLSEGLVRFNQDGYTQNGYYLADRQGSKFIIAYSSSQLKLYPESGSTDFPMDGTGISISEQKRAVDLIQQFNDEELPNATSEELAPHVVLRLSTILDQLKQWGFTEVNNESVLGDETMWFEYSDEVSKCTPYAELQRPLDVEGNPNARRDSGYGAHSKGAAGDSQFVVYREGESLSAIPLSDQVDMKRLQSILSKPTVMEQLQAFHTEYEWVKKGDYYEDFPGDFIAQRVSKGKEEESIIDLLSPSRSSSRSPSRGVTPLLPPSRSPSQQRPSMSPVPARTPPRSPQRRVPSPDDVNPLPLRVISLVATHIKNEGDDAVFTNSVRIPRKKWTMIGEPRQIRIKIDAL